MLRVLTDDLTELLEEPAEKANTKWVLSVVDTMLDNLKDQFQLEEQDEYLAEVLQHYPNWHPQIEHLRQQHNLLHDQLCEIRERLATDVEESTVPFEARRQLRDWIHTYNEHQRRERQLIQDAFTLETVAGE
jgi:hypothetical protein